MDQPPTIKVRTEFLEDFHTALFVWNFSKNLVYCVKLIHLLDV